MALLFDRIEVNSDRGSAHSMAPPYPDALGGVGPGS